MSIEAKLYEEIERELDEIYKMPVGSQEHTAGVKNLKEVANLAIDMQRQESEDLHRSETRAAEERAREAENQNKAEDRKVEKQNRMLGHVITGVIGIGGLVLSAWGFKKAMIFEEVGTIASQGGRIMLNRLLSKK